MTAAPSPTHIAKSAMPAEMLDALLAVFSAKGFDGASLAQLSQACGRSKASLYHHFPGGKGQMIDVLVTRCADDLDQRAFQRLAQMLNKSTSGKPKAQRAKATQALEVFLDGFADYLHSHQGNCLLATLALTQPKLLGPRQSDRVNTWLSQLASAFELTGCKPKAARRQAQALLARLYGSLTITAMGADLSLQQTFKRLKKDLQSEMS